MMELIKTVIRLTNDIIAPVLAVIGAWIIYNQYKLQRLSWRLSLYDKRYPVFIAAMELIAEILRSANATDESMTSFLRMSRDSKLLFGGEISTHLDMLYKKSVALNTNNMRLDNLRDDKERADYAAANTTILQWFVSQAEVTPKLFAKYLRVED